MMKGIWFQTFGTFVIRIIVIEVTKLPRCKMFVSFKILQKRNVLQLKIIHANFHFITKALSKTKNEKVYDNKSHNAVKNPVQVLSF